MKKFKEIKEIKNVINENKEKNISDEEIKKLILERLNGIEDVINDPNMPKRERMSKIEDWAINEFLKLKSSKDMKTHKGLIAKIVAFIMTCVIFGTGIGSYYKNKKNGYLSEEIAAILAENGFKFTDNGIIYDINDGSVPKEVEDIYIIMTGDNISEENLRILEQYYLSDQYCFGLIVEPTDCTYASIFKTIDKIKELNSKYEFELPIIYDIDVLYEKGEEYDRANILLGDMFCSKLQENGFYVCLTGTDENLEKFETEFEDYTGTKNVDAYDKVVKLDSRETDINNSNIFHSISNKKNEIFSNYDYSSLIKVMGLNRPENYVDDKEYIIKRGDTLSSIANLYNIKTSDLIEYNDIKDPDNIKIGDKIIIPNCFDKLDEESYKLYEIQKGDTLNKIAEEHNVSVDRLKAVNNISNPNIIKAGDSIKIPIIEKDITRNEKDYDFDEGYVGNQNNCVYIKGIDISKYNVIDWDSNGRQISKYIDFAILRICSDYDSGKFAPHLDDKFKEHLAKCKKYGIPVNAVYGLLDCINDKNNWKTYSKKILEYLQENGIDCFYLDIEKSTVDRAKSKNIENNVFEQVSNILDYLHNNGIKVGLYVNSSNYQEFVSKIQKDYYIEYWITNSNTYKTKIDVNTITDKDIEKYTKSPKDEHKIIQVTENGKVIGIKGSVDIDVAKIDSFVGSSRN